MSDTYTPKDDFPKSILMPDDGDDFTAFVDSVKGIGDRTESLTKTRTTLADLAALRAIDTTKFADGVVRTVKTFATFVFDAASSDDEEIPWIIKPTVGLGRWIACLPHVTQCVRVVQGTEVDRVTFGTTPVASRSVDDAFIPINNADIAGFKSGQAQVAAINLGTAATKGFLVPITEHVIDGTSLTRVRARFKTAFPHPILPGVMPAFAVRRVPRVIALNGVQSLSSLGFATDPTAVASDYDLEHDWTFTADQFNRIDLANYTYDIVAYYEGFNGSSVLGGWVSFELTFSGRIPARALPV